MKRCPCLPALTLLFFVFLPMKHCSAQSNANWEVLWTNTPPSPAQIGHPNRWMIPPKSYTGIAYDRWRDVLYVVNPDSSAGGPTASQFPRIHAWKATDGTPATDVGRSAFPALRGQGGELPVPPDTIASDNGFSRNRGFAFNRWCLYKIDLDDEGRIFACNLVSPLMDLCILLPSGLCDPAYMNQGPFRVWRWDTPTSTPMLVYATLDQAAAAIATNMVDMEMTYTRWGDAFDVIGKRAMYTPPSGPPYLVDSARIYVSGGSWPTQPAWNHEVNVFLADTRPLINRPVADVGNYHLDYRLAVRLVNAGSALASHGVAATGTGLVHDVWMDSNHLLLSSAKHVQHPTNPWPQTYNQPPTSNHSLSTALTGESGPIRYFELPEYGRKFLVLADGNPTGGSQPGIPNDNTKARVLDVTTPGSEFLLWSETPPLGNNKHENHSAAQNWIADVDFKLQYFSPQEMPTAPGLHLTVFVLMSNNGIAAYRSRSAFPVELTTLRATVADAHVDLSWQVTMESNNHGFEVQRSFDGGRTWENAGFVAGRGSVTTPKEYSFRDPVTATHRAVGTVKYCLRQVDFDGGASFSPIVEAYFDAAPAVVTLQQNYPNPFNPSTTIAYQLGEAGQVTLRVYNALGEYVGTLVDGEKAAGAHQVTVSGNALPSGTYIYRLTTGGTVVERKMTVVK
ncbi:MAG: T9SS type A sorting domain-containing protein [Bacteroidota bacterium]|nr:T9SS type A sorting domain-containing protein [Bacteroidota bacterium]